MRFTQDSEKMKKHFVFINASIPFFHVSIPERRDQGAENGWMEDKNPREPSNKVAPSHATGDFPTARRSCGVGGGGGESSNWELIKNSYFRNTFALSHSCR